MANIARGSRSSFAWKEETTYGVAPGGNWNQLPLNSETFGLQTNAVVPKDIRADRRSPMGRSGNKRSGGNIVHDGVIIRSLPFFRHLLACGAAAAGSAYTVSALAASTAYARGDFVKNNLNAIYVCVVGGTTDAGVTSSSLTVTSGQEEVAGASSTTLTFEYAHAAATNIYEHTFTGGTTFPTGGLSVEKSIIGGDESLFQVHKGCRINTVDISIPQEDVVSMTWGLLSNRGVDLPSSGAGTPVLTADDSVNGFNAFIQFSDDDGSDRRRYSNATLQISNGFDESVFCIGEQYRSDLPEGTRTATGTITTYFSNKDEYDAFMAETIVSIKFSFVHNGAWMEIHMPECRLTGNGTPQISTAGAVTASYEFRMGSLNGAFDIKIKARNNVQNLPV